MSDSWPQPEEDEYEGEVVDALPVLAEAREVEPATRRNGAAMVQTAAVAATGFVAGVATAAVLGRRVQRQVSRARAAPAPEILSTRTFLVSVHLLGRRED